jgi:MFS family permease
LTAVTATRDHTLDPERLAVLRRRTTWTLFAVAALASTGYIAAVTAGTIAAAELGGTAATGGLPTALTTLGSAGSAALLSLLMLRLGRRPGVLVGIMAGVIGGVLAFGGVAAGSLVLLLAGSVLLGAANAAGQLGRYIAADLAAPERRAAAIGTVVWGSTIGAVAGPNLIGPADQMARSIGLPSLAGAYLATLLFVGGAWLIAFTFLRPEPYRLAHESTDASGRGETAERVALMALLQRPSVVVALVTLVAGQVVMVLIMTMTPLHLTAHGHGLVTVGLVLSAHTFGMFALSPISGRLTDRFGSLRIIGAGLATLGVAAVLAALAPPDGGALLTVALFLLGYGWNLGFVAGSALLASSLDLVERTRVQGVADGLTWGSAAVASLASGLIVAGASYTLLGLLALVLLVPPVAVLAVRRPVGMPPAT